MTRGPSLLSGLCSLLPSSAAPPGVDILSCLEIWRIPHHHLHVFLSSCVVSTGPLWWDTGGRGVITAVSPLFRGIWMVVFSSCSEVSTLQENKEMDVWGHLCCQLDEWKTLSLRMIINIIIMINWLTQWWWVSGQTRNWRWAYQTCFVCALLKSSILVIEGKNTFCEDTKSDLTTNGLSASCAACLHFLVQSGSRNEGALLYSRRKMLDKEALNLYIFRNLQSIF